MVDAFSLFLPLTILIIGCVPYLSAAQPLSNITWARNLNKEVFHPNTTFRKGYLFDFGPTLATTGLHLGESHQ